MNADVAEILNISKSRVSNRKKNKNRRIENIMLQQTCCLPEIFLFKRKLSGAKDQIGRQASAMVFSARQEWIKT